MNSTDKLPDCMFWTRGQLNPENYDSNSFGYISIVCAALTCVSFPISSLGNLLVLIAMIKTPALHTTANVFIGSLAFSDFLIGAFMQPMLITVFTKRRWFLDCAFQDYLTYFGIIFTSTSASLMAAVSCERYICLFFHLRYQSLVTPKRCFIIVIIIWLYWIADTSLFLPGGGYSIAAQVFCTLGWGFSPIAIGFCYFKILGLVRHHRSQIQSQQVTTTSGGQSTSPNNSQAKLAVTMGYVIWASIACYTPTTVVTQMYLFIKNPNSHQFNAMYCTLTIQVVSSALNPIIYCWRRHDIRNAIKLLLGKPGGPRLGGPVSNAPTKTAITTQL